MLGLDLHSWEQWMLLSLGLAAFAAVAVVVTTASVVILTRHENAETKNEYEAYKLTVDGKVADAKKEGIQAGEKAGNALVRAAELEKQAAELKSANLALEAQIQPRRLSDKQMIEIASDLSRFAGRKVKIVSLAADAESSILGLYVIRSLEIARIEPFDRRMTRQIMGGLVFGILVSGSNQELAKAIVGAFKKHIDIAFDNEPVGGTTLLAPGEDAVATEAMIFVGVKPLPNP